VSWDALSWAAKQKVGKAADKLILLALAERHNPESGVAYPSVAWLAEFGSLNRKTVIASLDRLEAAGMIADSGQRMGKTLQIKAYNLNIETVPKTEQSQKRNSPFISAKQSQKRDTEPVREPVTKVAKATSVCRAKPNFPAPQGVMQEVWDDFLASPKRRKAGMSGTAYAGILNNLQILAEHGFPPGRMIALAVERGWTTVKLDWVQNDERSQTNRGSQRMAGHQPDGLSSTARAAIAVFGPPSASH
jgi:DNA-binding transcriptional regulator YhcF (GntR family)